MRSYSHVHVGLRRVSDYTRAVAEQCLFRKRTPSPIEEGLVIMGKCALKGSKSSSTAQYASSASTSATRTQTKYPYPHP